MRSTPKICWTLTDLDHLAEEVITISLVFDKLIFNLLSSAQRLIWPISRSAISETEAGITQERSSAYLPYTIVGWLGFKSTINLKRCSQKLPRPPNTAYPRIFYFPRSSRARAVHECGPGLNARNWVHENEIHDLYESKSTTIQNGLLHHGQQLRCCHTAWQKEADVASAGVRQATDIWHRAVEVECRRFFKPKHWNMICTTWKFQQLLKRNAALSFCTHYKQTAYQFKESNYCITITCRNELCPAIISQWAYYHTPLMHRLAKGRTEDMCHKGNKVVKTLKRLFLLPQVSRSETKNTRSKTLYVNKSPRKSWSYLQLPEETVPMHTQCLLPAPWHWCQLHSTARQTGYATETLSVGAEQCKITAWMLQAWQPYVAVVQRHWALFWSRPMQPVTCRQHTKFQQLCSCRSKACPKSVNV